MTTIFVLIALVTLAAAAVAMSLRNLIRSALLLIASWAGIAAFYLWAGAEFVSFAQILVYVGAVSMIVLFAVLLTRRSRLDVEISRDAATRVVFGLLCGGAVCGVLVGAVYATPLPDSFGGVPAITVKQLGTELGGAQAASLLVAGVVLTVALLGAVVLAATDKEDAP
jgi:NADH:ubiquinone oxidoreductase subunit 6 (subunit J)